MRWWSTASIRVRLTAWYTAVLFLMLLVYGAPAAVQSSTKYTDKAE